MMQVLALAAPRRGIGRTVLIDRLARLVERAGTGPVVLLDADPNQQLTQHWAEVGELGPIVVPWDESCTSPDFLNLKAKGSGFIIIDAPPLEHRAALSQALSIADLAEKHMTPDQVAEAQRLAREWEPMKLLFKKEDIADLQNGLAALGYNPGFAYGIVGPQTKEAIRAFQRDQGLPVDGEASMQLWYDILREGLLPKSEEKKAN